MNSDKETKCCCCGGGEAGKLALDQLETVLAKYQGVKGALIPVLQEAQHVYGYLPREVIQCIARKNGHSSQPNIRRGNILRPISS